LQALAADDSMGIYSGNRESNFLIIRIIDKYIFTIIIDIWRTIKI